MGVVLVDGDAPPGFGGHAGSTVTEETPAYGCCACGHQWGQWLADNA